MHLAQRESERLIDVLETAWKLVLKNGGAAGCDDITLKDVMDQGVTVFLQGVQKSLVDRTYKADPVKRVYIPKSDGSLRPLGIPTVKDRVVQMALVLIIEPIFEADFLDCSYGFRPEKSAHQAIDAMMGLVHLSGQFSAGCEAPICRAFLLIHSAFGYGFVESRNIWGLSLGRNFDRKGERGRWLNCYKNRN